MVETISGMVSSENRIQVDDQSRANSFTADVNYQCKLKEIEGISLKRVLHNMSPTQFTRWMPSDL